MWNTETIWFDLAVLNGLSALGSMLLGHFEQRTGRARARQVVKLVIANFLVIVLSVYLGRAWVFGFMVFMLLAVLYVHLVWLPRHGVNGWTGEPRRKYWALRGWSEPGESEKGDFE